MEQTIFISNEVHPSIPKSIFCNTLCTCSIVPKINQSCRDTWFSVPPKHSTVRVNLLSTTVEKVLEFINGALTKEGEKQGLPVPAVYQHDVLQDCLVIPPWSYDKPLTRHEHEVIVDAPCGAAVLRGANVFAPGVIGMLPSIQEEDFVSVYADSGRRCKRGLIIPFTDPGKVFVGNGIMRMSRKYLFGKDSHPKGIAVEVSEPASGVASVDIPHHLGLLQNLPSVVCAHVVSPTPGDKVIDLCAAPGHKTTHLASLMGNKGILVALDKIPRKIESLKILCQSMHAECVKAFTFNSTKAVSSTPGADWSPPFGPDTFDHVLLDAPCSALGQRPQLGNNISAKQITSFPKLQRKLFNTAVQLVKPGGSLVYSTCSLTTAENEDIVSWALHMFPQLELVPANPLLGKPGNSESSLSEAECKFVQRFGPPVGPRPEDDTIGFFIAKFVKIS